MGEAMVYSGAVLGVQVTQQMSSRTMRQTVKEGGFFSKVLKLLIVTVSDLLIY